MGEGRVQSVREPGDFIYGEPLRKMHSAQNYVFNMGLLFTLDTYLYLFENKICKAISCLIQNKSQHIHSFSQKYKSHNYWI